MLTGSEEKKKTVLFPGIKSPAPEKLESTNSVSFSPTSTPPPRRSRLLSLDVLRSSVTAWPLSISTCSPSPGTLPVDQTEISDQLPDLVLLTDCASASVWPSRKSTSIAAVQNRGRKLTMFRAKSWD